LVAAALCRAGRIGIDIEDRRKTRRTADLSRFFGPSEQQHVSIGGDRAFYEIWTLREAYAKARGPGFAALVDQQDHVHPGAAHPLLFCHHLVTHTLGVILLDGPKVEPQQLRHAVRGSAEVWSTESGCGLDGHEVD
jgi:hypothetical protein